MSIIQYFAGLYFDEITAQEKKEIFQWIRSHDWGLGTGAKKPYISNGHLCIFCEYEQRFMHFKDFDQLALWAGY